MKHLKTALILCTILCSAACSAQPFKVIKATSQHWAGGIVGRVGINYTIELDATSKRIIPDTVWINGMVYPLDFSGANNSYTRKYDSASHKIIYTIFACEMHNTIIKSTDTNAVPKKPIRQFKGVALISYMEKKKQRFYTIKAFTLLKQLNYP